MLHLMFPTHAAVGYLLGTYSRFPVAYLVAGSVLPDVVDRPLYWLGVTPFSHTVAHSLVVAVPVCVLLSTLFGRRGLAVSIGWLFHLLTDFLNVLTSQGLSATPYYVLYLSATPAETTSEVGLTVGLPATDLTHTLHPAVLAAELAVLAWATVVFVRNRSLDPERGDG